MSKQKSILIILYLLIVYTTEHANANDNKIYRGTSTIVALNILSDKYEVKFSYDPTIFDNAKVLNKNIVISSLSGSLEQLLPNYLEYKTYGSNIVITRKKTIHEDIPLTRPLPKPLIAEPLIKEPQYSIRENIELLTISPLNYNLPELSDDSIQFVYHQPTLINQELPNRSISKTLTTQLYVNSSIYKLNPVNNIKLSAIYFVGFGISSNLQMNNWQFMLSAGISSSVGKKIPYLPSTTASNSNINPINNLFDTSAVSVDTTLPLVDTNTQINYANASSPVLLGNLKFGLGYSFEIKNISISTICGISINKTINYKKLSENTTESNFPFPPQSINVFMALPTHFLSNKEKKVVITPTFEFGLDNQKKYNSIPWQASLSLGIRL